MDERVRLEELAKEAGELAEYYTKIEFQNLAQLMKRVNEVGMSAVEAMKKMSESLQVLENAATPITAEDPGLNQDVAQSSDPEPRPPQGENNEN